MMEYYYSMGQDSLAAENIDEAVTYFRKAANLGAGEAAREIGVIARRLETGNGLEKDERKASHFYRISGELGESEAWIYLGRLYLRGINGAGPNPRKARRAFEHASEAGYTEATVLLAKIYDEGAMGKVNSASAFKYYRLAAERGSSEAMLMTGLFYAQGESVPKDIGEAERWIRKGKEAGDPDADETLRGFLAVACTEYLTGAAGTVDEDKAAAMAGEAEEMGDKEVYLRMGYAYRASHVENRGKKAFESFRKAAEHKLPEADAALGLCYESGLGVEADISKAVKYYKKAAEKGNAFAMAHYGCALANGEGVKKDEQSAMEWLIKAAMKGDEGAILILKEDYDYTLQ
mgnify:CR=1 FL=1